MLRIKYEDMVKEFNRVLLGRSFSGRRAGSSRTVCTKQSGRSIQSRVKPVSESGGISG